MGYTGLEDRYYRYIYYRVYDILHTLCDIIAQTQSTIVTLLLIYFPILSPIINPHHGTFIGSSEHVAHSGGKSGLSE